MTRVAGVCHDTRRLKPGEVFVAITGMRLNALDLVPQALAAGASAIVAEAEPTATDGVPLVLVPSARAALADLAAAFYGHPSRRLPVVGITGTDGKTSTAHLLSAILEARGLRTGWLTTVNTKIGPQVRPNAAEHTTPEAPLIQQTLAEMLEPPLDVAILEASSHALGLQRVRGTRFRVGIFTNLSPEHINFHGSFEAYREAKSRLFASLPPDGLAVLNADDPSSSAMQAATQAPVLTYGLSDSADVQATSIHLSPSGTTFTVRIRDSHRVPLGPPHSEQTTPLSAAASVPPEQPLGQPHAAQSTQTQYSHHAPPRPQHAPQSPRVQGSNPMSPGPCYVDLRTRLVGRFNVVNWLAAFCAATYFGATLDDLRRATEQQGPVPGRMNLVEEGQPFPVVVDFAHTPQALEKALDTVRSLARGRVFLVFGLAGGRDSSNRPVMGELAARKSDYFIITMDDPGEEDPVQIARQIAAGARAAGTAEPDRFAVELDRRAAIRMALKRATAGDVVLLAGKGHENRMVLATGKLPWNDSQVASEELRALGYHPRA